MHTTTPKKSHKQKEIQLSKKLSRQWKKNLPKKFSELHNEINEQVPECDEQSLPRYHSLCYLLYYHRKKTFYHRYLKEFLILLLATPGAELQPESSLF